jgi:NADPH:quinone reductase-like Zn-dependent oxidoreductase
MTTLPSRMIVIAIKAPGGSEVLVPEEHPVTPPGPGEILVKVAAAGVNRPDVRQRQGTYPPPKGATDIPGLEIAGEVVALGLTPAQRRRSPGRKPSDSPAAGCVRCRP